MEVVAQAVRGPAAALFEVIGHRLPPAPAAILVLADEPEPWCEELGASGYVATGLPWAGAQRFIQFPRGPRAGLRDASLVPPRTGGRDRYDVVAVLDYRPDVHPLALFDEIRGVLADDGLVLLAGERSDTVARLPRWQEYVAAIAPRCGFVAEDASASEQGLNDTSRFLMAFRPGSVSRWQVAHVRSSDFPEIAVLFQEVFGHALSRELWTWKYGDGRGNAVVARRDGNLVAHYGGMYRDILFCGTPDWAFQICDVMVHARERGVLTRQGPFLQAAATCAEIYGPLGYGFPNRRAMLVAEKLGLYSPAGEMAEVRWTPASPGLRLGSRVRHLMPASSLADRKMVDGLWAGMAADLRDSVVGVRDWAYLDQRYLRHPHNHYDVLLVSERLTGRALGVVVLRKLEQSCELLDVVAPLRNLRRVIDQARRMTARWGSPHLYCWITKNQLSWFLACDGKEEPLDISIPSSCWTADARAQDMKDKWWLMAGDTDFR